MQIDLHTHSNGSDGTLTPAQLMHAASVAGLDVIGLTDHDSTIGWDAAVRELQTVRRRIGLARGAEISCRTDEHISVHLLGLLFDPSESKLATTLATTRDDRVPRMHAMIAKLNLAGIAVTFADVEQQVATGATLGRPHLADALIALRVVKDRGEAFDQYLNNDSPFYVSHISPSPIEAINLVNGAGGVSILAHPGANARNDQISEIAIAEIAAMAEAGLTALEVDHRDHSPAIRTQLRGIANDLGLLVTGASDFHGTGKLNVLGENQTSETVWNELVARSSGVEVIFG